MKPKPSQPKDATSRPQATLKFPLCEKYGLIEKDEVGRILWSIKADDIEQALSKAFDDGLKTEERVIDVGYEAQKKRIVQLEDGLTRATKRNIELIEELKTAKQQGKLDLVEELRNQIDFDEMHRDIWSGCILYAYGTVGLIEERLKSQLSASGATEGKRLYELRKKDRVKPMNPSVAQLSKQGANSK